ncbi:MAG: ABC transporter permease [Rhodobacteraceae bacterium]|nr:ABC transporter permease [Paracoccaceae bacterium]
MGERRFGRVNWLGLWTLILREVRRFTSVWTQTILGPLATAGLFVLVFQLAIGSQRGEVLGLPFVTFLVPGIVMMTVIQNAFANTSSSILISKIQGNIVDTLMPPLSPLELTLGYVAGGVARGVTVAGVCALVLFPLTGTGIAHPFLALAFVVVGSALLAILGMLAGILATKFDHLSALTNFVVTPLSFLSGTFYSVSVIPGTLGQAAALNPMFFLIDGARHGVTGISDGNPYLGLAICLGLCLVLGALCWALIRAGYRLKA